MNILLGNRIKTLRIAANFTQEQIAEEIGVSRQKYARIEGGTNNVTLEELIKIAKVLDVQVGDITKVLDQTPVIEHRAHSEEASTKRILEMVEFFYANKHLNEKLYRDKSE